MPNLTKMIKAGQDLSRVAFLIAAYRHYLRYLVDDKGQSYEIAEPWLTSDDQKYIASNDPLDFLGLSPFKSTDLKAADCFVGLYSQFVSSLKEKGVEPVLQSVVA